MNIIDISRGLISSPPYPGDPAAKLEKVRSIENGDSCNLSVLTACVHNATHIDAPLHFISGGSSIEKLPLDTFAGECRVIEIPPGIITGEYVERFFPRSAERLLIKSDGKSFFMESAAYEAAELGISLIGTDALTVGVSGSNTKVHRAFLSRSIPILEGLDLSQAVPGRYFLCAFPVKIDGSEGAFTRAVLIDDHIFWSKPI